MGLLKTIPQEEYDELVRRSEAVVTVSDRLDSMFQMQMRICQLQGVPLFDFTQPLGHNAKKLLTEWIAEFASCWIAEGQELKDWVPWKHWSVQPGNKTDIELWSEAHLKELKMEVVDIWHFVMDVAILLGMSPQELYELYCEKHNINVNERHASGKY